MTKTILVTGGGRGIGRAVCLLAGQRGWSVAVNYAGNEVAARKTVLDVETAGGRAIAIKGDVSSEGDVVGMFDACAAAFGVPTGVVNNAAILMAAMPFPEMTVERLRRTLDVNVLGAQLVAREAARRMLTIPRNGRDCMIVNVSSNSSRIGGPGEFVDYAASKGAMDVMSIGLSKELGPQGIRVNTIRPGLTATEIHDGLGKPGRLEELGARLPLGQVAQPDEVAEAIIWLLSPGASYMNGAFLDVDGGR